MQIIKSLGALGLCLLTAACVTRWEPQYGPVPQTAAANQGSTARVVMNDGSGMEMRNMRVEGDSIVGETGAPPHRVAVAMDNVRVISVAREDTASPINTGIKAIGAVAIALIAAAVIGLIVLANEIP
jgi:hypothetical protein